MTIQSLINKLEKERAHIDDVLRILRPYSNTATHIQNTWAKHETPKRPYKKRRRPGGRRKAWYKTPAGRRHVKKMLAARWAGKRNSEKEYQ